MTPEQLAARVYLSASLIRRVEAGTRTPTEELAKACDDALGCDGALMELFDRLERRMTVTGWRKSSFSSGNGGNCLEAGDAGPAVAVRDTKQNGEGPVLAFTRQAWATFTAAMKD